MKFEQIPLDSLIRLTPCVTLVDCFKNDDFIVQVSTVIGSEQSSKRLAIRRVDGKDGILWDEIQEIKDSIGFECYCACELFPPKTEVMNNMNARHIFLLEKLPDFAFKTNDDKELMKQMGL